MRIAARGSRLVGAARALSDSEYHATIYDVVVAPDLQRRGIGCDMMSALLAHLPVWRILLVADGDASRFYQRLGFQRYANVLARIDRSRLFDPARSELGAASAHVQTHLRNDCNMGDV